MTGEENSDPYFKVKAGAFLAFAGGFGMLAGFGGAIRKLGKPFESVTNKKNTDLMDFK